MIIILEPSATEENIEHIVERLQSQKLNPFVSKGIERTVINIIGDERVLSQDQLEAFPGVEKVISVLKPFKLASREFKKDDSIISADGVKIGGPELVIIAGPCSVENRQQIMNIACEVKKGGATFLRGGAFKPRTSPYAFQGLEEEGLKMLASAKEKTGLPIVTELMDIKDIDLLLKYADVIQIGARNMQNFSLLKELGNVKKPVLLKRGMSATVTEFLMSAEYILAGGNSNVILCERGIRTFVDHSRNTLDVAAIPVLKSLTHLPVIVDPSHATGKAKLIAPLTLAAIAAGCDGLMIEVHTNPEEAFSDGEQSITPLQFKELVEMAEKVAMAVNRSILSCK
jgi:3-deoxy-7-phosphoheptulonate synthase